MREEPNVLTKQASLSLGRQIETKKKTSLGATTRVEEECRSDRHETSIGSTGEARRTVAGTTSEVNKEDRRLDRRAGGSLELPVK